MKTIEIFDRQLTRPEAARRALDKAGGWDSLSDKQKSTFDERYPIFKSTFDETSQGLDARGLDTNETIDNDECEPPTPRKRKSMPTPLDGYFTDEKLLELFTRPYMKTNYDMENRPQWTRPDASDEHEGKHHWPARDEALKNTLMVGGNALETLRLNGLALEILSKVRELIDAAPPSTPDWLKHAGHGAADELEPTENSGYGGDVIHDYGPSKNKIKRMWEYGTETPSEACAPWSLGIECELMDATAEPETGLLKAIKALRQVGAIRFNLSGHMSEFRKKNGWLRFETKTRRLKGKRAQKKLSPDPRDVCLYTGAALPRNKKGELATPFLAGKVRSSNSLLPDTPDFEPGNGPTHAFSDPYVADIAASEARHFALGELSYYRELIGRLSYEALLAAAAGMRFSEFCGGRLGNKQDSARGRALLQVSIELIIEDQCTETGLPEPIY